MDKENNLEIYYSPHNEYLNSKAKVFIIGITPGFQQMSTAIATARKEFELGNDIKRNSI
jgi:glycine cleavage system H lipoate-binding protein